MSLDIYFLRRLAPNAFTDNVGTKGKVVTPTDPIWIHFKPGLLLYVYWFIVDYGTRLGKYMAVYVATSDQFDITKKKPKVQSHVYVKLQDLLEGTAEKYMALPTLTRFDAVNGVYAVGMHFIELGGLPIHKDFYIGAFIPDEHVGKEVPYDAKFYVHICYFVVEEVDFKEALNAYLKLKCLNSCKEVSKL